MVGNRLLTLQAALLLVDTGECHRPERDGADNCDCEPCILHERLRLLVVDSQRPDAAKCVLGFDPGPTVEPQGETDG